MCEHVGTSLKEKSNAFLLPSLRIADSGRQAGIGMAGETGLSESHRLEERPSSGAETPEPVGVANQFNLADVPQLQHLRTGALHQIDAAESPAD